MPPTPDPAALELSPEDMKALGYRVIDMLVDHHVRLKDCHPAGTLSRAEAEALLREPAPVGPSAPEAILEELENKVIRNTLFPTHPRHFGWIPGLINFVGAMADVIASGFNFCPGLWLEASAASQVELVAVDWLREVCGLPEGAGGLVRERRLGRQPHGVGDGATRQAGLRLCRRGGLLLRPDPSLQRQEPAHPRLRTRAACLGAERRRASPRRRRSNPGDRRRPGRGPAPVLHHRQRGHNEHRVGRSPRRAGRSLRRARPLVSCRRCLRRGGDADREGARGHDRDRACRFPRYRSAQMVVPALRDRLRAGPRRALAAAHFWRAARISAGYPHRRRSPERDQFRRLRGSALPGLSGAQALDVDQGVRHRRLSGCHRPGHKQRRARRGDAARDRRVRDRNPRPARHRNLPL